MILKSTGPGSSIALVAPSSPFRRDLYEKGREILEGVGYKTVPGKSVFESRNYLAGTDLERAGDLSAALSDPGIGAVLCIRGGYGSGRILPWLPFQSLRKNPKLFVGHSDITFLHLAFFSQMGWPTLHGPNLTGIAAQPERAEALIAALSGRAAFEWRFLPEQVLREGRATGPVLGGNLTCLSHLVGTPYLPDMTGAILLIEDCSEALYRLDRMINHLKLAGILSRLGGLLLGDFDNCADNIKICEMVLDHVKYYDYPVVQGLPFGHGSRNEVIPFGSPFLLDTYERVLGILENPISA